MKTFKVQLTKSYIITINAENENDAKNFCEFYTSDINDISTEEEKIKNKFEILDIDCKMNESIEVSEN